jgi:hypothetical protein
MKKVISFHFFCSSSFFRRYHFQVNEFFIKFYFYDFGKKKHNEKFNAQQKENSSTHKSSSVIDDASMEQKASSK